MLIIDRFEGEYAICENDEGEFLNISRNMLPENTKEGSVIIFNDNKYFIDEKETAKRTEKIKKLQDSLWQ